MPPRIQCQASRRLAAATKRTRIYITSQTRCAVPIWQPLPTAIATSRSYATASPISTVLRLPDDYIPPSKPPSARRPEARKSQLLRTYTSLLRTSPLILMFQHNNLTAMEWASVRRELRSALAAVPPPVAPLDGSAPVDIAPSTLMQVVRTRMFSQALKIVEFYDPTVATSGETGSKTKYTHDLSKAAYEAVKAIDNAIPEDSTYAQLAPLLVGPLALLTFPAVSPQHLAAALSILAPSPPTFPAPSRKKNPNYYDLTTQTGLQKLLLVGGRIESKVFDPDGVKWVGGIEGGLDGLRAQLVAMLQSAGMGLTSTLEGTSKSLWLTMESRRTMLEDAGKEGEEKKE